MEQAVALNDVGYVARGAYDGVHQSRVRIHPNVGLHAKVPFIALLAGVHPRIALFILVLGGTWRRDQCVIDCRASLEQ